MSETEKHNEVDVSSSKEINTRLLGSDLKVSQFFLKVINKTKNTLLPIRELLKVSHLSSLA